MKKFLLLSSIIILLGACAAPEPVEKENSEPDQEIEATEEAKEANSIQLINKPLTKIFEPKVSDVPPPLTNDEQDLHHELNERIDTELLRSLNLKSVMFHPH